MPFPGVMWLGVPSIIVCRFCWKCSQNVVMGIEQTIKNGSARYSLLVQKGTLQTKGLGASTLSGRSDQVLSLRRRFPPLAPHKLRTRVTIFPGCHLRFVLVDGVMSNTCKLLSGGLFCPTLYFSEHMQGKNPWNYPTKLFLWGRGENKGLATCCHF